MYKRKVWDNIYQLSIYEVFLTEALFFNYRILRAKYCFSKSKAQKVFKFARHKEKINRKNHNIVVVKRFIDLPNDIKQVKCDRETEKISTFRHQVYLASLGERSMVTQLVSQSRDETLSVGKFKVTYFILKLYIT